MKYFSLEDDRCSSYRKIHRNTTLHACVPLRWLHIDAYLACIVVQTTGYDIREPKHGQRNINVDMCRDCVLYEEGNDCSIKHIDDT